MNTKSIILTSLMILMGSAHAAMIHPGTRSASAFELDFVKTKIATGAEPWTSHLNSAKYAGGSETALGRALNWYLTGDVASANAAIAALKTWNTQAPYEPAPANGGNQSSLEGAWAASVLAPAAEIMSQYSGWSETDKNETKNMFRTVFLPAMLNMSYWNGNVDLTQIDALLSIAVFLDDQASFDEGIERLKKRLPAYFYLASDDPAVRSYAKGTYNWSGVNAPVKWVDGITQESCRDNGHHAQFAIAAALSALETAYLQGVDLYTPHQERMVDAMELMALQLNSNDMQGACGGAVTADRYNTLEIGYNHYHNRKGVAMPETGAEILKELRSGANQFNMFHETLTNAEIDYSSSPTNSVKAHQRPWSMSVNGNALLLNANPGTPIKVVITNLLGSQRKVLFEGAANKGLTVGWTGAMPRGHYILIVQVGYEQHQMPVSILGQ